MLALFRPVLVGSYNDNCRRSCRQCAERRWSAYRTGSQLFHCRNLYRILKDVRIQRDVLVP